MLYSQTSNPFVKAEQLSLDRLRRASKKKLSAIGLSKSSVKKEFKRITTPLDEVSQSNAAHHSKNQPEGFYEKSGSSQHHTRPKPTPLQTTSDPITNLFQVAKTEYIRHEFENSEKHLKEILEVIHQKSSPSSSPTKTVPSSAKSSAPNTAKPGAQPTVTVLTKQRSPINFNKEKRFNYFNKVALPKEKAPVSNRQPVPESISNVKKVSASLPKAPVSDREPVPASIANVRKGKKKVSAPPPKVQVRPGTAGASSSTGVATIEEDETLPEESGKVATLVTNIENGIRDIFTSTGLDRRQSAPTAKSVRPKTAKNQKTRHSADKANATTSPIAKKIQLELYKTPETVSVAKIHDDKFEVVGEESERAGVTPVLGQSETPVSDVSPRVSDFSDSTTPLVEPVAELVAELEKSEKMTVLELAPEEERKTDHDIEQAGTHDEGHHDTIARTDSIQEIPAVTTTEGPMEPPQKAEPSSDTSAGPLPMSNSIPLPDKQQDALRKSTEQLLLERLDSKKDIETLAFLLMSMENGLDLMPPMSGPSADDKGVLSVQNSVAEAKPFSTEGSAIELPAAEEVHESNQAVEALQSSSGFMPGEPLLEEEDCEGDKEESDQMKQSRLVYSAPASLKSSRVDLGTAPGSKSGGPPPPALVSPTSSASTRSSHTSVHSLKSAIKKGPTWHSDAQLISARRVHFPVSDKDPKMFKSERQLE